MTIATKNTYPAKDFLALCGMTWNKGFGRWESSNFDADKWAKLCNVTYHGPKKAKICQAVLIETI